MNPDLEADGISLLGLLEGPAAAEKEGIGG
jgi:hypothetical protein